MVAQLDFPRRPAAASRRSLGRRAVRRRGSAAKNRDYIYGSYIDQVLCMVKANGDRFFYSVNDLYSVYALTDATGNVVERYMFDPYGAVTVLAADGVTVRAESLYGNPWTFTGRRLDGETGLMYFRNRMYEVDLGRFVGRDPAGYVDGYSQYGAYFVGSGVDPFGEAKKDISAVDGGDSFWYYGGFYVYSVDDFVDKVKEKVGEPVDRTGECGNCIRELMIHGHGAIGEISVGAGTKNIPDKQIKFTQLTPSHPSYNANQVAKLKELTDLFCYDGSAVLRGCNVGQGPGGELLRSILAEMWRVPVTSPTGKTYWCCIEGEMKTTYPKQDTGSKDYEIQKGPTAPDTPGSPPGYAETMRQVSIRLR